MRFISYRHDTEAQSNQISKDFLPIDRLSKINKENLPSLLSASKDQLRIKGNIALYIRNWRFTHDYTVSSSRVLGYRCVVRHSLHLRTHFAILTDERKVPFVKATPIAIVKKCDVSGNVFFTEHNTQDAKIKPQFEKKDD